MLEQQLTREFSELLNERLLRPSGPDRLKVLVVEDDFAMQPLWERIIHAVSPRAIIRWAHSEEGAEALIENRRQAGESFDLIVTDIFLDGERNGVDLWKKYGGEETLFLFTSGISPKEFSKMIGDYENEYPVLLQKPVRPRESADSIRMLLTCRDFFTNPPLPRGQYNRVLN